ncbi:ABC transporter permease [Paenibacillus sp. SYP-B3998]|uniref:ABC transporter permease n=1 Tax=Paenibacillus sp. SYP-B3998 TaxID=2678564 RepID=A0A6G3ZUX0_9BACL|nr:ABC transporter permease [Paenibacillus sp. SYP-B3998]NEW05389.1 ABC transporter permease [Paenibacillus sp. SYP-B3998]
MHIWTIAWYEVLRMMRMRYVFIIQFLMPLLLIFILGSALSNTFKIEDKTLKPVKVDVVQGDTGAISSWFDSFVAAQQVQPVIQTNSIPTREEAVERVKAGESEFALIIPNDFSAQVLQGKEAQWEMILGKDYGQNLTAQMVLRSFLDQINQIQATMVATGPGALQAMQNQGSNLFHKPDTNAPTHVRIGKMTQTNANYTATQYYAASMLIMFLLYSGMSAAIGLQNEKEKHTLSRLNSLPISNVKILMGKILGNTIISLLQAFVIIAATIVFYGVDWGHSYLMLFLVCLLIIVVSMSLAIVVMIIAGSTKSVNTIFQMLILAMTFLSGGFTPLPDGLLHQLGEFTINYWGMQSLFRIMLRSDSFIIIHHVLILAAIGACLLVVSLAAYRKAGYHD